MSSASAAVLHIGLLIFGLVLCRLGWRLFLASRRTFFENPPKAMSSDVFLHLIFQIGGPGVLGILLVLFGAVFAVQNFRLLMSILFNIDI